MKLIFMFSHKFRVFSKLLIFSHTLGQARSQEFVMGELLWGLGAKLPAAGGKGVWGRNPQRSAIFTIFQQK